MRKMVLVDGITHNIECKMETRQLIWPVSGLMVSELGFVRRFRVGVVTKAEVSLSLKPCT